MIQPAIQTSETGPFREWMVSLLKTLTQIESPSTDKAAVDRLADALTGICQTEGAGVSRVKQSQSGDCLICRWEGPAERGILLLAHMDTVFPLGTLSEMPWKRENGRIMGPGTLDMKAGIVQSLAALRILRGRGEMTRPVTLLLTPDEEIGSQQSRGLIEEQARGSAAVFCLEPAAANGAIKTSRKGTGNMRIEARGRASHAGVNHAAGRNAIQELAWQILEAQKLTNYETGTTVNVGVIGGGTRANVVPDFAWADCDLRILSEGELNRLKNWAAGVQPRFPDTQVSVEVDADRPPMPRDALMAQSFSKARDIAQKMGLDLREIATGGGSDGNFVAPLGIPLLDGLGPVGDGAHSPQEFLTEDSWMERTALLANLIRDF